MILLTYQEVIAEKIRRQQAIKELQYHASGHCVHLGQISPGCRKCFTNEQGSGIQIGNLCMSRCPYCYYDPSRTEEPLKSINNKLADFFYMSLDPTWNPTIFSYQSAGETLMYIDELEKFGAVLDATQARSGVNQYRFVYTNGILANREMLERVRDNLGAHEIRFHLSASDFSEGVFDNMKIAAEMGFFVTVEEPSWPHHRKQLFDMLPRLQEIGVKHLDMVEVQLTSHNRSAVDRHYPGKMGKAYKDYYYHLYDEGLVYDIMEEVVAKGYTFSVMDCSSAVERCRHAKDDQVLFDPKSMDGACAPWNY